MATLQQRGRGAETGCHPAELIIARVLPGDIPL
jgi:hypothetical protein